MGVWKHFANETLITICFPFGANVAKLTSGKDGVQRWELLKQPDPRKQKKQKDWFNDSVSFFLFLSFLSDMIILRASAGSAYGQKLDLLF